MLAALAMLPATADAQRRGYPLGGQWDPEYRTAGRVRLEVTPKQAQVYVDGYYVGTVDDFNGTFQRLVVAQGDRELVLYLQGYKTIRQTLQVTSRQDYRVRYKMERLAAGQTNEPPPEPPAQPPQASPGEPAGTPPAPMAPRSPRRPPYAPRPARPSEPPPPPQPREPPMPPDSRASATAEGFGSLVFRVQPAGAEVLIDGDRWQGPEGDDRLVVQVSEGSHRVEIRKDGYTTFSTQVTVRGGETLPLNVSLTRRGE
jgi:hypothetical protein